MIKTEKENPFTFLGLGYIDRSVILLLALGFFILIGLFNNFILVIPISAFIFLIWGFLLELYAIPKVTKFYNDQKEELQ